MHDGETGMGENNSESNDTKAPSDTKAPQLLQIELRVLGALMEKQLTTPDAYPLTLNSLINACNQKSSREPVTSYHQGEIARTLTELESRGYVRKESGSRADKYEQRFINQLGLGRKQQALLCIMMLRGPQTLSELNTRTQRMCEFVDKEDLELSVERLCERSTPYAIRLGQQAGQRGERISHLFSGTPAVTPMPRSESSMGTSPGTATEGPGLNIPNQQAENSGQHETIELLEMEVTSLNRKVESLQSETTLLREQLETLYKLTGQSVTTD